MRSFIYTDHAATTPLSAKAWEAMEPFFRQDFGNPSGIYSLARRAKQALEDARERVARSLGAEPGEIHFTSGGSESDNWAIASTAKQMERKGKHIISTCVEHHAVMHTLQALEKQGFEVTYLPVDAQGRLNPGDLEQAIRPDTILVSVMAANNEIGTIYPIPELAAIARAHGVRFHTDAVQAVGHIPVDVKAWGIDLLSLSGHKFQGPKGVGALYIRKGTALPPLLYGGQQERGKRAGTENVAGIVGMSAALEEAVACLPETTLRLTALRNRLLEGLSQIPYSQITGETERRLPGNASFVFRFIEGESMLMLADQSGICASSGSACSSASLDPSYVLLSLGLPHEIAHGSVRFSLGPDNTEEEIEAIIETWPKIIHRLREMSPLWEEIQKQQETERRNAG